MGVCKTDEDPPHGYTQTFLLKSSPGGGWFVQHDVFRLSVHNL